MAARLSSEAPPIQALCEIAEKNEAKFQTAATWILKRFQENGLSFSPAQIEACLALLGQVNYWEAKLHLLQMLPAFTISAKQAPILYQHLMCCLTNDNKFLRAWAYNGLAELATQYPEFQTEVAELLRNGQKAEAASIKARIRNILKKKSWADIE